MSVYIFLMQTSILPYVVDDMMFADVRGLCKCFHKKPTKITLLTCINLANYTNTQKHAACTAYSLHFSSSSA